MKILITGGTGLIGQALIKQLTEHDVVALTRDIDRAKKKFAQVNHPSLQWIISLKPYHDLNDIDAVINLAGEPIADKRWTHAQKKRICQSRWDITESLVSLIHASTTPPDVFISGSAVGFYGDQQSHPFDESLSVCHNDFAHNVCAKWEEIAKKAASESTRVCLLRTGVVLSRHGGALPKMAKPFTWGLGGPIGDGQQYIPWIHINDMVGGIVFLLNTPHAHGPFNMTAVHPTTNLIFSRYLGKVLHRPVLFPVPKWMISLIMGEAATLVFDSIRAKPQRLIDLEYPFQFTQIEDALTDLYS